MKVTNTGDQPLYLGSVNIAPHTTADVPDDVLAEAKKSKVVEGWFANGTLKTGDAAADAEAESHKQSGVPGTPNAPGTTGTAGQARPNAVREDKEKS
jgi:hypothetical protein